MERFATYGPRAVLAAVFALWACIAQAVTLNFDEHVTGVDLGATTVATLEANDVAGGVQMTLTNVAVAGGIDAFLTQLLMTYDGALGGLSLQNDAGVAASAFNTGAITNASFDFDFEVLWPTSNAGGGALRLNIGESSTFTILGATLADLFNGTPGAMLHVQGLDGGGSTKYIASVVPLPAAGLMLLGALGLLGVSRRRSNAA